jgi:hypothetical protein
MPSGGSPTEAERAFRSAALCWNNIGVAMLLVAFALSAAASVASYCE